MADAGGLKPRIRRLLVDAGMFVDADFWAIALYSGPSPVDLRPAGDGPILGAADVSDAPAVFVADPFMIPSDTTWHMFFEVFNRATDRGEIAVATSHDGLAWAYEQIVLAEPYHLSYPHVFAWRGEHYMVPETMSQRRVYLYRARDYPAGWEVDAVLLEDLPCNDASLFRHGGRWWMLVETSDTTHFDTLRLYGADDLHGPWTQHPASPVVKGDATAARPAGRVVSHDGRLVRYAQDCSTIYGERVFAFEILELDAHVYRERLIRDQPVLEPSLRAWNDLGMHHIDAHEVAPGRWLACVDGRPRVGLRRWPRIAAAQRPARHSRSRSNAPPRRT